VTKIVTAGSFLASTVTVLVIPVMIFCENVILWSIALKTAFLRSRSEQEAKQHKSVFFKSIVS
jgi:hypothetical protein